MLPPRPRHCAGAAHDAQPSEHEAFRRATRLARSLQGQNINGWTIEQNPPRVDWRRAPSSESLPSRHVYPDEEDEARERRGRRRRRALTQGYTGPQCKKLHGLLSTVQLVQQRAGVVRHTKSQMNVVQPHRHDHLNATLPSVQRGAVWCAPIECDMRMLVASNAACRVLLYCCTLAEHVSLKCGDLARVAQTFLVCGRQHSSYGTS